eukprot:TRINITY_DN111707_c0_g1_i1.p1 TRINITY_DN111707_c0_g1~~TRINITY_DN111707_c0_g1_i1.p1  ORF type:complete len:262 (-),score=38.40 TRINITY_DN111707_c0_g1_i1:89-874(-)
MPTAPVNGIDLYYEDTDPENAAGLPTVIFGHGAMGNTLGWWQSIPALRGSFRCITYDIRGYGRSPDPTNDSMNYLISDLGGLIDYLSLRKVSLLAQSMAGRAALGYAVRNPERIDALVLADNWGGFDWPAQTERASHYKIPEGHPRGVAPSFPMEQPALFHLWHQIGALNPKPRPKLEGPTPGGPTLEDVRKLQIPVLCLVGQEDVIFPPPLIKALADELPNAEYVEVAGAGHSVYFEKADVFNGLVLNFVKKHTGNGGYA